MLPKRLWIMGVIAAGVLSGTSPLVAQERLLMREATKVVDLNNGFYSPVLWRSDHSALLLPYEEASDSFHFVELDTNTGIQKSLESLDRGLGNHLHANTMSLGITWLPSGEFVREATLHFPPECTLSPDGNWLLATNTSEDWRDTAIPKYCIALSVDGNAQPRLWSGIDGGGSIWADNSRWLESIYSFHKRDTLFSGARLHNVNNGHPDVTVPIPVKLQPFTPMGMSANSHLFLVDWRNPRHSDKRLRLQVANLQFNAPKSSFNKSTIKLPMAASVQYISISTDGTRIAWLLEYRSSSPHSPQIDRPIQGLWISRLDGSDMIELGHRRSDQELTLDENRQPDKEVLNVQWLPGDKKISFIFRGALYTIPVP